ncbi:MAG TPA: phage holin family protein [Mycobacteriales bacterium]|nr:phage holin family protein [Mycobacteriales bacterium]
MTEIRVVRTPVEQQTLGQLVASASRDLSQLVRSEIELAKAELRVDIRRAGMGGAIFGAAGFLLLVAALFLSVALAYGIAALGLPLGVGFLLVGVLYLLVAGLFALVALRTVKRIEPPHRTIKTVKDDIAWLKHPTAPPAEELSRGSSARF